MQCYAKRGISLLPVTALHVIEHGSESLLLCSEGSRFHVELADTTIVVRSKRVFHSQIIHGIASCFGEKQHAVTRYHIIIWGGRLVCTGDLVVNNTVNNDGDLRLYLRLTRPRVLDDWVMTVVTDDTRQQAVLLTAHNVLWSLSLVSGAPTSPFRLGQGMSTLLYSGAVTIIDASRILVSSGTVFGEVIVWICLDSRSLGEPTSLTQHLFLGHSGSIFGVAVSDMIIHNGQKHRFLASCSDDRTIRIWDISDCDKVDVSSALTLRVSVDTGFGIQHDQNSEVAVAWAHLSRIWGVYFMGVTDFNSDMLHLVSRGEDGACHFWELPLRRLFNTSGSEKEDVLRTIRIDRYHAGKNVWSLATGSGCPQAPIYTGGADGKIISRQFPRRDDMVKVSVAFGDITNSLRLQTKRFLKQYLVINNGAIVATTDQGEIIQIGVGTTEGWRFIYRPPRSANTILCENSAGGLVLYCLFDGSVCLHDVMHDSSLGAISSLSSQAVRMQIAHFEYKPGNIRVIRLVVNLYGGRHPELLEVTLSKEEVTVSSRTILLPTDFAITASLYYPSYDLFVCGSRAGALMALTTSEIGCEPVNESSIIRRVHDSDAVTSIMILPQRSEIVHLLSTGRNGTFNVHRLRLHDTGIRLDLLHRATLPLGPHIEGAFIRSVGTQRESLCLYGFKSKDFVVWNETDQTQILSVDCGGAHRNWSFSPCHGSTDIFVWTKAGTFNYVKASQSIHEIIRKGGHGREIKALAMSSMEDVPMSDSMYNHKAKLIATGAEDTDIRLMVCMQDSVSHVGVLKQHTTGLQALRFSSCGHYLFSSGGVEEFIVWRLARVPIVGIGTTVICTLAKNKEDEDARIMDFDVLDQNLISSESRLFIIAMAYSNGKVKVFEFHHLQDNRHGHLRLLQTLIVGTLCLSQVCLLTSGESVSILVGASDGLLRYNDIDESAVKVVSQCVHQSNIATMSVRELSFQVYMVVTGGDDNSLGVSFFYTEKTQVMFKTLLIPNAHAAALTATTIVRMRNDMYENPIYIVSAGNDQRLRIWKISGLTITDNTAQVGKASQGLEFSLATISLAKVYEYTVDVADISGLEVVDQNEVQHGVEFEILVVGVGMQSIRFKIQS